MTPHLQELLDTAIMSAIATGIAKSDPAFLRDRRKELMIVAQKNYQTLVDYLDLLEVNQRETAPPKFWRDHEPLDGKDYPI